MKTLKNKIRVGVIFLFAVILLLSILGIFFINQLAQKSKGTITDNYSSVDYMMNMINSLDSMYTLQNKKISSSISDINNPDRKYTDLKNRFENNLQLQTANITEKEEGEWVSELNLSYRDYISSYKKVRTETTSEKKDFELFHKKYSAVRNKIYDIYRLNMGAITNKTNNLQKTADNVTVYMALVAGISILTTLLFIFTFPSKITEPIKELTEKIKSISERNYDQQLEVTSRDELGELAKAFNIMAARLKMYEAQQIDKLLYEQKRLEAVVKSFEDGILLLDENRKIVLINKTFIDATGLKEESVLDTEKNNLSEKNELIKKIYKAASNNKSANNSGINPIRVIQNGKEYFYNIETEEIITYSKSEKRETFIGKLIILRNITKYQERDDAKTNLLATASHELKTPLSSINLSIKLLEDSRIGNLNNEQKEVIISLKQQSGRLSRVINELLDYSQIETGNIKLKFMDVKPDLIADIGISSLMMQISEKDIKLKTIIEEGLPDIRVDIEKLAFVFINILNNALRYSNSGGEIKIEVQKINNEIKYIIKDNGPGISKEDQMKLFQRYTQVGNIYKQGRGLGLAISKEFLQAQGGRIWVESEKGKGSHFIFTIPAKEV